MERFNLLVIEVECVWESGKNWNLMGKSVESLYVQITSNWFLLILLLRQFQQKINVKLYHDKSHFWNIYLKKVNKDLCHKILQHKVTLLRFRVAHIKAANISSPFYV